MIEQTLSSANLILMATSLNLMFSKPEMCSKGAHDLKLASLLVNCQSRPAQRPGCLGEKPGMAKVAKTWQEGQK